MKKGLFIFTIGALVLTGCSSQDGIEQAPAQQEQKQDQSKDQVADNVKNVFGVTFDPNQDWCTTTSGTVAIKGIPDGATSVQLFALISKEVKNDDNQTETETSLLKLNEATNVGSTVNLVYDAPKDHQAIYAAAVVNGYRMMKQVKNGVADFSGKNRAAVRRRAAVAPDYSSMTLFEDSTFESFASQRGWLPGQKLYGMSGAAYEAWKQAAEPYSAEYTQLFRDLIFSYFKNGRQYNNLPLVMESKLVNDKVYPVTTGAEPIIISPVYKSDKAQTYGNEIYNSDLYYYYFKEEALTDYIAKNPGKTEADFLNALPKYKAIPFNQHFGSDEDDVIDKRFSYSLIYWGDGEPDYNRVGQPFPAGYKIGFMVRAKTVYKESNGQIRKQGELYGDGRLNNEINNYSKCNFTSSKLPTDGPRACWLNVEDRLFLAFESGTDADFNDIIMEVEGGIDPISFIPEFERDFYTFCFEDREIGDYDMNDVVIKATRINQTTVEYSIVACGAYDQLQVRNVNGAKIKDDAEIHALFGVSANTFINTQKGATAYEAVTDQVTVSKDFSFLNAATQPYIHNVTMNKDVKLSQKGEDPHGIMIPYDFRWPLEKVCIKDAYLRFNEWGQDSRINSTDWYKYPVEGKVY